MRLLISKYRSAKFPLKQGVILLLTIHFGTTFSHAQDSLVSKSHKIDSSYVAKSHQLNSSQRAVNNSLNNGTRYENRKLDSIQRDFHHRTDSLQKAYAAPMSRLHAELGKLNHKKDSLNKLKLPTVSLTHKIDSLERAQTKKLNDLNAQIEKTKRETLSKVSALHLPPEAQKELDAFTKNIHGFSVPNNFFLPNNIGMNLKIPGLANLSLSLPSTLGIPKTTIPSLQKFNLNSPQLPSLSQLEGPIFNDIKNLQSLKTKANQKAIEQEAMKIASQNKEINSLTKEQAQVTAMEKQLSALKNPKKADSLAMTQLKPAINHFAGKEKELQSAMGQISKLKNKYSEVKSLAELPKRPPNPLKNKPWQERVVPGVNYFIRGYGGYTFVDFNPSIGWKFNPHLTASIGWNQRVGFSHGTVGTPMYDRVYGIRSTVSYLWTHGILFTASPEVMQAYIPTNGTVDEKHQALLWGVYGGVRKNFPIYKSFSGYSEVLYHFAQKPGKNIYGDPVVFRFGIEMKLKRKVQKSGG